MIPRLHIRLSVMMLVWLVTLSGCGSTETYNKKYYILQATRQSGSTRSQTDFILDISRLTIDSAFSGSGLVYRTSETGYESDFYNEFLASPSAMITDIMRNWLSASRLFKRVLDSGSQIDPTHIIEGNITALYGDFRDNSSPKAILEMRIFLLETETGEEPLPIFGKTYTSSIDIKSEDPEGLVEALGRCLQGVLSTLESDLTERLS